MNQSLLPTKMSRTIGRPRCDCTEKQRLIWYHVCEVCRTATKCSLLRRPQGYATSLLFCNLCCIDVEKILKQRAKDDSIKEHLARRIRNDYRQIHPSQDLQEYASNYKDLISTIWREISPNRFYDTANSRWLWNDAYAADSCEEHTRSRKIPIP